MSLILYGSTTSPYVRRIRIFMEDIDYEFKSINVYDDASRPEFNLTSPIKKLPVLKDDSITIFDSHNIHSYLCEKFNKQPLNIEDRNIISVIDAVLDSLIILFQSKLSDMEISESKLIHKLQLERIPDCLQWLNSKSENSKFDNWNFITHALISLIDWIEFRELYDLEPFQYLLAVRSKYQDRKILAATKPHT